MDQQEANILTVEGLNVSYGNFQAVQNVSFQRA